MRVLPLILSLLFTTILPKDNLVMAQDCFNYCSGDTYYSSGAYNSRSGQCEYSSREGCAYGCDARSGCNAAPQRPAETTPFPQTETQAPTARPSATQQPVGREEQRHTANTPAPSTPTPEGEPDVLINPPPSSPSQSGTLTFNQGSSGREQNVSGDGVQILVEGMNVKVVRGEETFLFKNNFGEIQDRYVSKGKLIENAVISVEKKKDDKEKVYINLELIEPVKLFLLFNTNIKKTVKIDTRDFQEVSVKRPWWVIFTREKSPEESIENYCKEDTDCQKYEDGNLCNGTLYCNIKRKQCVLNPSTVIECPEETSADGCSQKACNAKTGKCEMTAFHEAGSCNDGNLCTTNDICKSGKCLSGSYICQCEINSDCKKYEDGNLCNGTLYCDAVTKKCEVNPATTITCFTQETNGCLENKCNPESGKCELQVVNIDKSCPSPDECFDSRCSKEGQCLTNWNYTKVVGSGEKCECNQHSDCNKFEDGNLCNGTMFCNKQNGTCETNPATLITCPSVNDSECLENTCEPQTGLCEMKPVNVNLKCDGGHPCYDAACSESGECIQTWNFQKTLDSGKKCECSENSDCIKLEDGNFCNGTLYCDKDYGTCKISPVTVVTCPSVYDTQTQKNTCQPQTGKCVMIKT